MVRSKSENPRDKPVLLRLTGEQRALLDAAASLERITPNAFAYRALLSALAQAEKDPLVAQQLGLHRSFDARAAGDVVQLRTKKRT
jgi:uncharacterized protein (DUF1778 family)